MRFARARYQQGRLIRDERKVGPDVWGFRWREQTPEGGRGSSSRHQQRNLDAVNGRTARKAVRPAAVRADVVKHIDWRTFRHSFATLLKVNGEGVKVVQESLRRANSRIALDVYMRGLIPIKRQAQGRVVKSLLAPHGPHAGNVCCCKCLKTKRRPVAQLVRAPP
jgi:integrase